MYDEDALADAAEGPSKSEIKREHLLLQGLAEQIATFSPERLAPLGLGEATLAAIAETARITDLRALRRHHKRIAKLLAREPLGGLRVLLAQEADQKRQDTARLHRIERWRERLLSEGDAALGELLDQCPDADRQALRLLVRTAKRDQEQGRVEGPRRLFRLLRELLDEGEAG